MADANPFANPNFGAADNPFSDLEFGKPRSALGEIATAVNEAVEASLPGANAGITTTDIGPLSAAAEVARVSGATADAIERQQSGIDRVTRPRLEGAGTRNRRK
jgi:hypothetical protein